MCGKDTLLFDLDGTLTDPKVGITKAVRHSLRAFGIEVEDLDALIPFIGPPLRDSYQKFYSFSEAEAEKAIAAYREYFAETGIFENALYPGIDATLMSLSQSGRRLALATSKPTVYAERILAHFALDRYFAFVAGSELDGTRSRKDQVIEYALDNLGSPPRERALMIGDREHDILGARLAGIDSVGVLYGYGSLRELTDAGATHIAESVERLSLLLCDAKPGPDLANQIDRRGKLKEAVFACRITKDKKVFISWHGRQITALSGAKAEKFIADIEGADDETAQLVMAKATGHFKHGNEKAGRRGQA